MIGNGYNGNGRPVVTVYGSGDSFTLHTPAGAVHSGLTRQDVASMLGSYQLKPVVNFGKDVPGGVKAYLRGSISNMPVNQE